MSKLMGKNIFAVDVKAVQQKLAFKYPQATQLKVMKKFPNQLAIKAKQRSPFAQTRMKNRTLTLDEEGVVLSTTTQQDDRLPLITGLSPSQSRFSLGMPIKGEMMRAALDIIKAFNNSESLTKYKINKVDIENLSKINLFLSNQPTIILDGERAEHKMQILSLVLSQTELDLKGVKYLDLRFKEPIIGRK